MDIVFLWDSDLNDAGDGGIPLSGKYLISYDPKSGTLDVERNGRYVDGFWGGSIRDCMAVVGDNGAGKTMLANSLMNDIRVLQGMDSPRNDFVMVVEENDDMLSVFYTQRLKMRQSPMRNGIRCMPYVVPGPYLNKLKAAYFRNDLSSLDYMVESRCDYDFSLGRMIRRYHVLTTEMNYDDFSRDAVWNYYSHEAFRIIDFLYDEAFQRRLDIPFPRPKRIQIGIADGSFNENYIVRETKKLGKDADQKEALEEKVRKFIRNLDDALNQFGWTWINCTVKSLILNCYKKLCIPQTVPDYSTIDPQELLDILNQKLLTQVLRKEASFCEYGFYMLYVIYRGCRQSGKKTYVAEDALEQRFIRWLEENEETIAGFERRGMQQLDIPAGAETRAFMRELIDEYSRTNFQFPFYDFSFGVSAGEYSFLAFFSNLYSMVNGNQVYDYQKLDGSTDSLLLIFDEADLSMHPRWQRMYIKWLTDACKQVFPALSLKIIVTTHSPVLLSDFPADSVLYLKRDRRGNIQYIRKNEKTFGCNIHTLYLNAFFLEERGTMGAFAEEQINGIAAKLLGESDLYYGDYERMEKMIDCIGEGIIRQKLELALDRARGGRGRQIRREGHGAIRETLEILEEQRNNMDRLIEELKERLYD